MTKLIAGDALRQAHERLESSGRLGYVEIAIGKGIDEIKRRRRVIEHPSVTEQEPARPRNKPPTRAEIDEVIASSEEETERDTEVLKERVAEGIAMLLDNRDRQALARKALDDQARPLAGRVAVERPEGRPTDERIAKSGGEDGFSVTVVGKGERAPIKRYSSVGVLDPYQKLIPAHIDQALKRFAEDAEAAGITRVTANYEGSSGVVRGPKTGGLGGDENGRKAYRRHQTRMREIERRLDTPMDHVSAISVLAWAVMRETVADGKEVDLAYVGGRICPERDDVRYRRGVALGAILLIGRALCCIDHEMESGQLLMNGGPGLRSLAQARKIARR